VPKTRGMYFFCLKSLNCSFTWDSIFFSPNKSEWSLKHLFKIIEPIPIIGNDS